MDRTARSCWPTSFGIAAVLFGFVGAAGCGGGGDDLPVLEVDMPLHLEDHLDAAVIEGSELPADPPEPVEWRFDEPQPEWKSTPLWSPPFGEPTLARTGEALRVTLTETNRIGDGQLRGVIHVDVPEWRRGDWAEVVVRARVDSTSTVNMLELAFNLRQGRGSVGDGQAPFQFSGQSSPVVRDGTIRSYRLRVSAGASSFTGPWRQLVLAFGTDGEPGSIDILSVSVVPTGATYAESPRGVRPVSIGDRIRRTIYMHSPGSLRYRVRVPEGGRLDAGLGVLGSDGAVTFRVRVLTGGEGEVTLLDERYSDPERWAPRSVDLSRFAGQSVTIALEAEAEAEAERPGTVALWGAPTVSGERTSDKPNVIFYVIDGGAADQMSLYGYNRRTTPNLERLALEGAMFEHAYSNAPWTRPSTTSFMTSLYSGSLGGTGPCCDIVDPLPKEVRTMAERFHAAGYATAVFTSNPNAGSVTTLERGVDVFRDAACCNRAPNLGKSRSSVELHRDFWDWRGTSPAEPYWVHFQTTDVHQPHRPPAPFAGLFTPGGEAQLARWDSTLHRWEQSNAARYRTEPDLWDKRFAETGIDRIEYYDVWRSLYDETMAHQDYQLGRLLEQLENTGRWANTLLIVAGDHSINNGSTDFIIQLEDSLPPAWSIGSMGRHPPILRSSVSRVPLLFIWPGHIRGGQRFPQTVSMIDVLPTVLELAGLPPPQVLQGQSLAPLLLGRAGWQPRPVILDRFEKRDGEFSGAIEMIDGRWGASLWIGPPATDRLLHRPTPLALFDVWDDPFALNVVNDEHPELVETYTEQLEEQWELNQLLARGFTPGNEVELRPEQLETLRSLGYIR